MSYPTIYRELRELFRDEALETENARGIIRKSGYKSLIGSAGEGPILSLTSARRVCFSVTTNKLFPGFPAEFAVDDAGQLYGWGANTNNIFAMSFNLAADGFFTPRALDADMADVLGVAHNEQSSMLLRSDGSVWTSGPPLEGAPTTYAWVESAITSGGVQVASMYQIPSGPQYILKSDGTIWARGEWLPGMGPTANPFGVAWAWTDNLSVFTQMPTAKVGTDVVEIAALNNMLTWRLSDGTVKVWENNVEFPITPSSAPSGITKLRAGFAHVIVLTDSGEIWTSGNGSFGEAGDGTFTSNDFAAWRQADGTDYTDVDGAELSTIAVKDGRLWTWGAGGARSARGLAASNSNVPVEITNPDISDVLSVHGHAFTYAPMYRTGGGCVYIWGANDVGSLGQSYFGAPDIGIPTPLLISEALEWNVVP